MVVWMFNAVQHCALPVVAQVHSPTIAGGCALALHCYFMIGDEDALFGMPLAQLGVTTDWFLTKKIMKIMGLVAARELLLLGNFIPARKFHKQGHIARAVPTQDLDSGTNAIARRLAANVPLSMLILERILLKQVSFYDAIEHVAEDAKVATISQVPMPWRVSPHESKSGRLHSKDIKHNFF